MSRRKNKRKKSKHKVTTRNFVAKEATTKRWGSGTHGKMKKAKNRKDRKDAKKDIKEDL